jgi:hypothetical protein
MKVANLKSAFCAGAGAGTTAGAVGAMEPAGNAPLAATMISSIAGIIHILFRASSTADSLKSK